MSKLLQQHSIAEKGQVFSLSAGAPPRNSLFYQIHGGDQASLLMLQNQLVATGTQILILGIENTIHNQEAQLSNMSAAATAQKTAADKQADATGFDATSEWFNCGISGASAATQLGVTAKGTAQLNSETDKLTQQQQLSALSKTPALPETAIVGYDPTTRAPGVGPTETPTLAARRQNLLDFNGSTTFTVKAPDPATDAHPYKEQEDLYCHGPKDPNNVQSEERLDMDAISTMTPAQRKTFETELQKNITAGANSLQNIETKIRYFLQLFAQIADSATHGVKGSFGTAKASSEKAKGEQDAQATIAHAASDMFAAMVRCMESILANAKGVFDQAQQVREALAALVRG